MSATKDPNYDDRFSSRWVNLAEERLGTKVLYANDDFFAAKENLIKPGRGVFIPEKYTDVGKWMDGWESRRKRVPGNDFCIVRLGLRGQIKAFDIDTNHFTGNHPPFASVEACDLKTGDPDENTQWQPVLTKVALKPSSQNLFEVAEAVEAPSFTHVRLQIYPDGGVARLRVYGIVNVDWSRFRPGDLIDLASVINGGRALACNDMFYSSIDNLIVPGRGVNMGDGWETKRKREPGFDWSVVKLGHPGRIRKIEVDTAHFKGNFPDRCSIEAIDARSLSEDLLKTLGGPAWRILLRETKLQADHQHYFEKEVQDVGVVTHVKLNIIPDGGVSRLRCWGVIDK